MKYLPLENITYKTKLSSAEILKRLNEVTEPRKALRVIWFYGNSVQKVFEGKIKSDTFEISRILNIRNSLRPTIKGRLEEKLSETYILVNMNLGFGILFYKFPWLFLSIFCCIWISISLLNGGEFNIVNSIPFLAMVFFYTSITGGFKYESLNSKHYLAKLFEASIED